MNTDKNVTQSQTEWKGVTIEELVGVLKNDSKERVYY